MPSPTFQKRSQPSGAIPRSFELSGNEAILRKEGDRLVLEPLPKQSLFEVIHSWKGSSEDFPEVTDFLPEPVEL